MIVSIGVPCKEIGPSLSLVLIKMATIWENLAALYGAKCRVPTNLFECHSVVFSGNDRIYRRSL